jgi:ATP-binding cassette subfamily B (MDR/TAP) protein 1
MATFIISGERQSIIYRKKYFKALLEQEIGWFDQINPNELSSKVAQETSNVQQAICDKIPTFIMTIFMTIGGFAMGYARGWLMALVTTAALPVVVLGAVAFTLVL